MCRCPSLLERVCHMLQSSEHKGRVALNSDNSQRCVTYDSLSVDCDPLPGGGLCFNHMNFWYQERNLTLSNSCKNLQCGLFCVRSCSIQGLSVLPGHWQLSWESSECLIATWGYHSTILSPVLPLPTEMKTPSIVSDTTFLLTLSWVLRHTTYCIPALSQILFFFN